MDFANVRDWLSCGQTPRQAFQSAIDAIYCAQGGGIVFAPPGEYAFDAPVVHKGGVIVQGSGRAGGTKITSAGADIPLWQFDASASRACLRDIFFLGRTEHDATQNIVTVADGIQVFIRDCDIWGGCAALFNIGADCRIRDCFIAGCGLACLVTNGANFYDHCKFDSISQENAPQWSVYIGTPTAGLQQAGAMENWFTVCDLSGQWSQGSIYIDDSASTAGHIAYTNFVGCPISGAVRINAAAMTKFSAGCRFGSPSFSNNIGSVSVTDCEAIVPLVLPPNVVRGGGNINIGGGVWA